MSPRITELATVGIQHMSGSRKLSGQALRANEVDYRDLLDNANDLIQSIAPDGSFLYVNRAWREKLGYSEEEIPSLSLFDIIHLDSQAHCREILQRVLSGEKVDHIEAMFITKDGGTITVEGSANCRFVDGKPVATLGIFRDITERKQAEEALRKNEERYRSSIELTDQVAWTTNADGEVVEDILVWRKYTGQSYEEVKGFGWSKAIHPDDVERTVQAWTKAVETKSAYETEYRLRRYDGVYHDFLARGIPVFKEDGSIQEWVGTCIGITERKRAEEALRQSKEKYRTLVEGLEDVIVSFSLDGTISYCSPNVRNFGGYDPEEEIGKHLSKYIADKEVKQELQELFQGIIKRKKPITFEFLYKPKSKDPFYVEATASPIIDEETDEIVSIQCIVRDITKRKQLEKQLRQAQKMEAVGTLAGGVAHDFNNILTGIQGYTDLALMEVQEDDPLYQDLNEIRRATGRAAKLTRQLLLFSRRQPMVVTSLALNGMIQDLTKMLNRLIGENICLNTDLENNLWTVEGDTGTIEQIIMNLVVNARDAMPEGGKITIKTENVHVDEQYCQTYRYARPGKFVYLSVQDAGTGMDQATINRIFEPFFSTKGEGKGTGLGLSVVYGIVKKHEGWINVESSPGKGANFKVYLPAVSTKLEKEKEQKTAVSSDSLTGKGKRILLVEDDEAVQEFTARGLSENGYIVSAATDAQEAMDIFQQEEGNFDLIFSDVVLPDENGPKLTDRFLKVKPGISVLFTSGYSDEKSNWRTIQERGYPYLQKPYSLSDLLRVVSEALGKR